MGDWQTLDLATDVDVVLMRQDPPFDIGYITATYLLERVANDTLVVNDPRAVRDAPEKLFVLDFARFMPPTMISRICRRPRSRLGREIVVKPLHGKAGEGVFRIGRDGTTRRRFRSCSARSGKNRSSSRPSFRQAEGDKRIVLVDGEVAGAINRRPRRRICPTSPPADGEQPSSRTASARFAPRSGPELKRRGLLFVGIDVIGGMMTEINVTSPTGIVAIDKFNGSDTPGLIWDAIETKASGSR